MSGHQLCKTMVAAFVGGAVLLAGTGITSLRAQTATNVVCGGCVHSSDIANFAVSSGKLSKDSVTNPKIATGAVTTGKIANGAVSGPKIAGFAVSSGKLGTASVTNPKIAIGAVTVGKIANGAVTSAKVLNDSLTAADIKDEAGADFAGGDQNAALSDTPAVMRSVTITAPAAGVVIVNASGYFNFQSTSGTGRCSITTSVFVDFNAVATANGGPGDDQRVPFGTTRGFEVDAGTTAFNLVCDEFTGDVRLFDSQMTAMYFPVRY